MGTREVKACGSNARGWADRIRTIAQKVLPSNRYLSLARRWQYLRNIGHKHVCPICNKHIKRFLSYGRHARPDALCPFCESLERHRLLWLFLRERTNLLSGPLDLLHLAPEPCLQSRLCRLPSLRYMTADLNDASVSVKVDIQFLPFGDASFDAVLCSHVLEHVPDDRRAMRETLRVLKPGGWAILQVPLEPGREETMEAPAGVSPEERERLLGHQNHLRMYGRDYERRLADAGFVTSFDSYAKSLPEDMVLRHGLSTQDIFIVKRPAC